MKAHAIVYTSNTGFTRRYAKMLGETLHLPVRDLKEAQNSLPQGEAVVYLGWLMAGSVKGLKKAATRYNLAALCAVGMTPADGKQAGDLRERGAVPPSVPIFYLRGGYAPNRIKGLYKPMMKMVEAVVAKGTAKDAADGRSNTEATEMARAFQQGGDWVSEDQLAPVIAYIRS